MIFKVHNMIFNLEKIWFLRLSVSMKIGHFDRTVDCLYSSNGVSEVGGEVIGQIKDDFVT